MALLPLFAEKEDFREEFAVDADADVFGVVPTGEIGNVGDTVFGVVTFFAVSVALAGVDVLSGAVVDLFVAGDGLSVVGRGLTG